VRNKNIKEILNMEVNPEEYIFSLGRSAPWRKQIAGLCIWFCAATFLWLVAYQALASFQFGWEHTLTDYGLLYGSASRANLHVKPYLDHPLVFHIEGVDRHGFGTPLQGTRVKAINLNPPVMLYPFRLLARLNPDTSYILWSIISVGLFLASIRIVLQMYPAETLRIRILWILAMGAVWYTFRLGQIYMILLFCASLAWRALRKHNWLVAGISIGVICAIKPNFLVWPSLLIAGKSKKSDTPLSRPLACCQPSRFSCRDLSSIRSGSPHAVGLTGMSCRETPHYSRFFRGQVFRKPVLH
jgi:hypothetical protein